jgi:uncharacterized protein YxeA
MNESYYMLVSKERRSALNGLWVGSFYQEILPNKKLVEFKVKINFSGKGKIVDGKGSSSFKWKGVKEDVSFVAKGGFKKNRFLLLEYSNNNKSITQFGNVIFEMMPNGKELNGRFQGYGFISKDIVNGSVVLHKKI